jgi:hypothetical protein
MVLSLSTNFVTPNNQRPTNEILERAGEQAPVVNQPDVNLDTTGAQTAPDTAQ